MVDIRIYTAEERPRKADAEITFERDERFSAVQESTRSKAASWRRECTQIAFGESIQSDGVSRS